MKTLLLLLLAFPSFAGVLGFTGFEDNDATGTGVLVATVTGTASIQGTTYKNGTYALKTNPTTTNVGYFSISMTFGTNGVRGGSGVSTIYLGFWYRPETLPSSTSEEFHNAGDDFANLCYVLRITSAGNIAIYDTTGTTLVATGSTVLSVDTWYYIEVSAVRDDAGAYEVRVNGVSELSGTGDFKAATGNTFGSVRLGKVTNRNGKTVSYYFDDLYVSNTGYLANASTSRVLRIAPTGIGNYTAWSGESDCSNVDEIPADGDTTILTSAATSDQRSCATANPGTTYTIPTGTVVHSIMSTATCKYNASGAKMRMGIRSSTTDALTTVVRTNTVAYETLGRLYVTDPATSAAWTIAGLDGIEPIIKEDSTSTERAICTAMNLFGYFGPDAAASNNRRISVITQ